LPLAFINVKDLDKFKARVIKRDPAKALDPHFLNILLNEKTKIYIDLKLGIFCRSPMKSYDEEFIELLYEGVIDYVIDIESRKILIDLAIYCPNKDLLLYIKSGNAIEIIEAQGKKVHSLVFEGDKIDFGDKLFYVVTNKNEVHVVKSHVKGTVLFIGEVFSNGIQNEVMVIVEEEKIYELSRCKY
jgi:hypothetical protein